MATEHLLYTRGFKVYPGRDIRWPGFARSKTCHSGLLRVKPQSTAIFKKGLHQETSIDAVQSVICLRYFAAKILTNARKYNIIALSSSYEEAFGDKSGSRYIRIIVVLY